VENLGFWPRSPQAEEGQDGKQDDNCADEPDDVVHGVSPVSKMMFQNGAECSWVPSLLVACGQQWSGWHRPGLGVGISRQEDARCPRAIAKFGELRLNGWRI
jgi:hypothetical protein